MSIVVRREGLLTTIQDLGRTGYRKYGVPVGGAMDRLAARVANLLVGNADDAAVCEMTLQGPELLFEDDMLIAVCGGEFSLAIDGQTIPMRRAISVRGNHALGCGTARAGCRAYLAVA